MTHAGFIQSFGGIKDANDEDMKRLSWSGLLSEENVGLTKGTPAQILEHILNKKWKLQPNDKDLVVMWHRFRYEQNGKSKNIEASLVAKGIDSVNTAMARTVGLPLGIAAKLLIQGKIKQRGVVIPTNPEIYEPTLDELKSLGIELTERHY